MSSLYHNYKRPTLASSLSEDPKNVDLYINTPQNAGVLVQLTNYHRGGSSVDIYWSEARARPTCGTCENPIGLLAF